MPVEAQVSWPMQPDRAAGCLASSKGGSSSSRIEPAAAKAGAGSDPAFHRRHYPDAKLSSKFPAVLGGWLLRN